MIFHFGINGYRDVRHCMPLYVICLPVVSRKCTLSLENHGVHGHQEHFTLVSMSTAIYATVRHCMLFVYRLSPESVHILENHGVQSCTPLYATVRHCMLFVYRLFPESVHFLENHNSQSEKLIVQLLLTPRSVLVKLDIQMHP